MSSGKIEHWKTGVSWFVVRNHGRFVQRSQLFYRYTYAVMFPVHSGKGHRRYYSIVGQMWLSYEGDSSDEQTVKGAVQEKFNEYVSNCEIGDYDPLVVVADTDWEPVPVDAGVELGEVDVRVEFKGQREWRRQK